MIVLSISFHISSQRWRTSDDFLIVQFFPPEKMVNLEIQSEAPSALVTPLFSMSFACRTIFAPSSGAHLSFHFQISRASAEQFYLFRRRVMI